MPHQVREVRLLRQLAAVMRQASEGGGFFDAWMKHNSDLVQAAADAYAGARAGCGGAVGAAAWWRGLLALLRAVWGAAAGAPTHAHTAP
jgi:hypothetical protein